MGVTYHLICHCCRIKFHGADRAKHIRNMHDGVPPDFTKVDKYGNAWTGEHGKDGSVQVTGAIRIGHEQEQEDIQKFKHFDTIPLSKGLPDEEEDTTDEEDEPVYKKVKYDDASNVNIPPPQPQIQRQVIVKNFKDTETIKNVEGLNRRLTEVINNFNGHIQKLYNEKANKADVDNLYKKVNGLNSTVEAIRRTLTEQSRMAGGVYDVYKHSKKHRTKNKTAKKVSERIEKVVKDAIRGFASNGIAPVGSDAIRGKASDGIAPVGSDTFSSRPNLQVRASDKVGGNANTENVLKNVNININAQRLSIERAYKLIQGMNDTINTLKARVDGLDIRVKSVEETNNVIMKNQLTEEDVVRIVKRILSKEGRSVDTEEIVNIIHNKDEDNEDDGENTTDDEEVTGEEQEGGKELSKHFKEEMNELINRMRLTNGNSLNKTTIKNMKKIIEKHNSMGHLNEIKKYMDNLPKNRTKNNKKKAIVRKHLQKTIENISVR